MSNETIRVPSLAEIRLESAWNDFLDKIAPPDEQTEEERFEKWLDKACNDFLDRFVPLDEAGKPIPRVPRDLGVIDPDQVPFCDRCMKKIGKTKSQQQLAASLKLILEGHFVRGPGVCGRCGKETEVSWVPGIEA